MGLAFVREHPGILTVAENEAAGLSSGLFFALVPIYQGAISGTIL